MSSLLSRMEQVIQSSVSDKQFMGSILVAHKGIVLLDKGYGFANLEWNIPNTPTTKFRIGSLTKQFTAAAILLLADRGKLSIKDKLKIYMPDAPETWENITIFNLLTHTSGIPNYTNFPEFASKTTTLMTPRQQIELFLNRPLDYQPGTQYAYCNSDYVLLGYLIEKISGQSYQDYVENNIFKHLGMNDSGYDSHAKIISQRASGYNATPNGICNAEYLDMSIPYSAGSLYSTTRDMLLWQEGLFGGKLLSAESLQVMITPFKNCYCCGVIREIRDNHEVIHHAGGINGFNTIMLYFPEDKLTVIAFSNLNAIGYVAQDIAMKMIQLVHGHAVILPSERKEITVSPETLSKYARTYKLKSSYIAYTVCFTDLMIAIENGHLMAQSSNLPKTPLFAESETRFFAKLPDLQIEFFLKDGNIPYLVLYQDGEETTGIAS